MSNRVGRQEVRNTQLGCIEIPLFAAFGFQVVSDSKSGDGNPAVIARVGVGSYTITMTETYPTFIGMNNIFNLQGGQTSFIVALNGPWVPSTRVLNILITSGVGGGVVDPGPSIEMHSTIKMSNQVLV